MNSLCSSVKISMMLEELDLVPMTFGVTSGTLIVVTRQIELVKVGPSLQLSLVGPITLHVRKLIEISQKCIDKMNPFSFSSLSLSSGNRFILYLLLDRRHWGFDLSEIRRGELF